MEKNSENKEIYKRITLVSISVLVVVLLLFLRLLYIQVYKSQEYTVMALKEITKSEDIVSGRGDIFDRNGKKLAVNSPAASVWVYPKNVSREAVERSDKEKISDYDLLLRELPDILGLSQQKIKEALDSDSFSVKLVQYLDKEKATILKEKRLKGIEVLDVWKRFYPNNNMAAYVLGFTGTDGYGLSGLELSYNNILSGRSGKWMRFNDNYHRRMPFENESLTDPVDGQTLVTTIDEVIQSYAEEAANQALSEYKAKAIHVLVMDPNNGDILAMTSKPDYNPNAPWSARSEDEAKSWSNLSNEELSKKQFEMWNNYLIDGIYEPGSTFKLVTAAAAIEEKSTLLTDHFYCTGTINVLGETLKCANPENPHGDLTIEGALKVSCNTTFVKIGLKLGKEQMYRYIRGFGFGEKTGIDLNGEQLGIIPASASSIGEVQLATMSYGHGVAVTPIQLLNAINTMANGGKLMKPRLVKEFLNSDGTIAKENEPEVRRQVISKETSAIMRKLMQGVVEGGSGSLASVDGYKIGGKTGTAYKIIDGKYAPEKYIASFAGVAPIDNPRFSVLFLVDEPGNGVYYGGSTAAPSAKPLIQKILEYLEIPRDDSIMTEDSKTVEMPNVVGMTLKDAGKVLHEKGIKYSVEYIGITEDAIIEKQSIEAGTRLNRNIVVDLFLSNSNEKIMPELKGLTAEEAKAIINSLGFECELEGKGNVSAQEPAAGTKLNGDMTIIIKAGDSDETE